MPVQMELSRILIRELNDYQLIELRELDGDRAFPIVIGLPEAQAIERRLKGVEIKRPQTHELMASVIESLGGELISGAETPLEPALSGIGDDIIAAVRLDQTVSQPCPDGVAGNIDTAL